MSSIFKKKLCLGDDSREYTVIGEALPFPSKEDSPVINEPQQTATLLWDHSSPTEKLLVQLSPHFPPLLWLSVKPTITALRNLFREFLDVDTKHMKKYLPYYEKVQNSIETQHGEKLGEGLSQTALKDQFVADMRKRDPRSIEMDWERTAALFTGTTQQFRIVEDAMIKSNPFVFGWPLLVSDGNHHLEDTPIRMAAFRTIYSKSLVVLHARSDLQLDHRQCKLSDGDEMDIFLDIPVFASVNYAENAKLCGGSAFVQRFNQMMDTSFPLDTPIDVLGMFLHMDPAHTPKGVKELREEMLFLQAASEKVPDVERVVRLTQDLESSNRIIGQLAYTILYLAIVQYSEWEKDVFHRYRDHRLEIIRAACAKGAHLMMRNDLVQEVIAAEPEGRCKLLMQRTLEMPQGIDVSKKQAE